jgi:hypothetical protein
MKKLYLFCLSFALMAMMVSCEEKSSGGGGGGGGSSSGGDAPAAKSPIGYWIVTDANDQPIDTTEMYFDKNYEPFYWTHYTLYHFTSTTMTGFMYDGTIVRDTFYAIEPPSILLGLLDNGVTIPCTYSDGKLVNALTEMPVQFPDAYHMQCPGSFDGYKYFKRLKTILVGVNPPSEGGQSGDRHHYAEGEEPEIDYEAGTVNGKKYDNTTERCWEVTATIDGKTDIWYDWMTEFDVRRHIEESYAYYDHEQMSATFTYKRASAGDAESCHALNNYGNSDY